MLGILHTNDKVPALHEIHSALGLGEIEKASALLLSYLTHPEVSSHLHGAYGDCANVLRYVNRVAFDDKVQTAQCNIIIGEVLIGVEFFKNYIRSTTDLLFILLHERNHYLIRRLKFARLQGISANASGLLEDAYINGPLYRLLRPKFLTEYYKDEKDIQTILYPASYKFKSWMKEVGYPDPHKREILRLHQRLYDGDSESYAHVDYEEWMKAGRRLVLWLIQKADEEERLDAEEQPCTESCESVTDYGSIGVLGNPASQEAAEEFLEDSDTIDPATGKIGTNEGKRDGEIDHYEGMEEDYSNGPTKEDIQTAVEQALEAGKSLYSEDPCGEPDTAWTQSGNRNNLLHAIVVPKVNLDGMDGALLQETWDMTLDDLASDVQNAVVDLSYKLNQVASLIGCIMSTPALQDTGLRGKSVYPYQIHRQDIVMMGAGYPPTSWNLHLDKPEEKVPLYVDVSISMGHWYLFIPWIVQHLKQHVGKVYQFSGTGVLLERPKNTQILLTSQGTCFNTVARHILEEGYKRVLILTDDDGTLLTEHRNTLQAKQTEVYLLCTERREGMKRHGWSSIATRKINLLREIER